MSYFIEKMDAAPGQKMRGLVENLTATLKELQELNKINATLTQYSLEITEDLMKIFCPNAFQNSLYQPSGKIRGSELTRVLIDTEV
jgi:flagellar biosynthesis/type III secretory pathway chaperone